jgi:type II secretory pathway component PulC
MAATAAFGLSRAQLALAGALTALAAGFGLLVVLEWSAPAGSPAGEALTPATAKAAEPAPVFSLAPLASFSAVTDRPLFSPDRRPAPQASETLGSWSALVLAGIVVTPGSREVLIAHGNPAKIVHLQEGQSVDGWAVRSIDPDRVVVANGGEQHELRFGKREDERSARGDPRRATTPPRD